MLYNHILYYQVLFMFFKFDFDSFCIYKLSNKSQQFGDQNSAVHISGDNFLFLTTGSLLATTEQSVTMESWLVMKMLGSEKEDHQRGH